jgi:hypothetical protein
MPEQNKQLLQIALRIVSLSQGRGVLVRILGGVAFQYHEHGRPMPITLRRQTADIDLAVYGKDMAVLGDVLRLNGWQPHRELNFLHGSRRLLFYRDGIYLDIFVDSLELCQTIELRGRLEKASPTLSLADLLLSKLQIIQLAEKDLTDIVSLLSIHDLGGPDSEAERVSVDRVVNIGSRDWGFAHTMDRNLNITLNSAILEGTEEVRQSVRAKVQKLLHALTNAPKSLRWRLRAQVGERYRWYKIPESEAVRLTDRDSGQEGDRNVR